MSETRTKTKLEAGAETRRYIMRNPVQAQRQGEFQKQRKGMKARREARKEE